jgi:hypothetical protein
VVAQPFPRSRQQGVVRVSLGVQQERHLEICDRRTDANEPEAGCRHAVLEAAHGGVAKLNADHLGAVQIGHLKFSVGCVRAPTVEAPAAARIPRGGRMPPRFAQAA